MSIDTIFAPSFGNRPSQLVGREPQLGTMLAGLDSAPGSRERSIVMLGQRGSGKTVLLWELAERARARGWTVANPTIPSEGMLDRIVEKLQTDASRFIEGDDHARISGGSIGALGFSVGVQFSKETPAVASPEHRLTQTVQKLSELGRGSLILIDELQANSPEVRQLVSVYQELVGQGLDVAIVMAGLPGAVSATLNDRVLTFLNRARKLPLPAIPVGDVGAFYEDAFQELGIVSTGRMTHRAAEASQGSAYLMQLLGHNIAVRLQPGDELTPDILENAVASSQTDFENDVCETTLRALSDRDVDFLTAMAPDEGPSRIGDLAKRIGVAPDYAQKYRRRLLDAGVVEQAGRGRLTFAVPYLREHLLASRL